MTAHDRNAAVYFHSDAYEVKPDKINGRRVAGDSFLRGFFKNADVPEFVSLTTGNSGANRFGTLLNQTRPEIAHRIAFQDQPHKIAPTGVLYYPAPNFGDDCWRRAPFGQDSYAICGITHTTATKAVMQGFHNLRTAPQAEWDAVICTSKSVKASVNYQFDCIDNYLKSRFGKLPERPLTPVIPIGIHCDDFEPQSLARATLRSEIGADETDIVLLVLSRLTPHGKFDPLPMYLAIQNAQSQMPKGRKLHLVLCGVSPDLYSNRVVRDAAIPLMPDVKMTILDGSDANERVKALSGADIFLFPIDNIQETFGLAPIEAMAAGLPVIVTDWDGMKDTVPETCGIRVPTTMLGPDHMIQEARRHQSELLNYNQFTAAVSAMTSVNVDAFSNAIVTLAKDDNKRKTMGQNAKAQAHSVYDWSIVIPQMQDLWAEQNRIRRIANRADAAMTVLPVSPPPTRLFQSYPSEQIDYGKSGFTAHPDAPTHSIPDMFKLRDYAKLKFEFETAQSVERVYQTLSNIPQNSAGIADETGFTTQRVERCLIWLVKYRYAQRQ